MNNVEIRPQTEFIPIVDLSGFDNGDPVADARIAAEIRAACEDKGFMYVTGHGVPETAISALRSEAEAFFERPMDEKAAISKDLSHCNRGYEPLAAQTLEPGAPPDQKEGFYIGVEIPENDPRVKARKFNHGPNQWPTQQPGFRAAADAYFAHMTDLGAKLMKGIALSLDLPADYFSGFTADPMCTLRLLHYPPQRPQAAPDEKGCGAHTDFGGLTLLWQDEVGGLEVFDKDTGWIAAPPLAGAYVINLGDMIQRWTNGRYRSTLHRVINRSGRERYSIPFFYTGNPDHEVRCIQTCLAPGEEPAQPPITVSAHIQDMYRRTYA
ncbi:MAG: isopenicillin N synthase family oxygenase [Roseitalea sp.]|jgi:isopenicillin N synthase-like dioxygenase|nr:isopenicillin N synthase family oxygenase [Roseitalea sp.]MBO6721630.1 isopenicillin N synthase family oxygenase [Roseitalea sp.]MBO6743386.1 isopenicillin N synthase family oxygenase [Roseitalea sp.]